MSASPLRSHVVRDVRAKAVAAVSAGVKEVLTDVFFVTAVTTSNSSSSSSSSSSTSENYPLERTEFDDN
ncbi:unnamed protein product [Dibothriocephalus latus]|uniref:Uncharacterized protein n=1 Tax=Dibothriocephalus latus TaxID=60516 RepID=A0A3P7P568_DIBLA|nr:unnamed protein product [Dibothriocephalus latus]